MKSSDYIEANRKMWNETAAVHADAYVNKLLQQIKAPDFTTFDEIEGRIFEEIGLAGKDVVHLACNNGRELIAVKKAGAGRCVGFDISDNFIAQAQQLAAAAAVDVAFRRANIYDIPAEYDDQFDLVYITIGALGWMPDLDAYFAVIARLLRPGGQLFIYEMHPVLDMFEAEKGLIIDSSYFRTEPYYVDAEPDYMDPESVVAAPSYWFHHKLSDIIGGCLRHGLNLTHFEEYDHDISMVFARFAQMEKRPPMCYSLVARKVANE